MENNLPPDELSQEERNKFYTPQRPVFCAGNYSSVFVLPDGKVTLCEELYWNPRFILGDYSTNSLKEIWNSPAAKELYYLSSEKINNLSPCKHCQILSQCRQEFGGVCWREIIKAYGNDKWDYPDPICPDANKITGDIYI
ncbi:MAG: SPASM domain-containing protein [Bacteroides sp.]|nr:SPASM domain-containing protein [Bacteroides sp.]